VLGEDLAVLRHEADAGAGDAVGLAPATSSPRTSTRPERGGSRPAMALKVVLLPAPLRPIRASVSPRSTAKATPNSTWLLP
jgi:hypothetical protein